MYDDDFTYVFLQMIWIETGSTAALGIDVDDSILKRSHIPTSEKSTFESFSVLTQNSSSKQTTL